MSLDIAILDAGLFSVGSHNFNYCMSITRSLRARGHSVRLFAFRDAHSPVITATGAVPHFQHLLWNRVDQGASFDEEHNWRVLNAAFEDDLKRLGPSITGAERVLLIPNILQHQIAGLFRWFCALPQGDRPRLIVNLMFYPRWTAWADHAVRGAEFYLRAIESVRPWLGDRVHLTAENGDIGAYYERLCGAPVSELPVPVEAPRRLPAGTSSSPPRFGFLGYSKNEKGFPLLPGAFACLPRLKTWRAVVQVHHHGSEPDTVAADEALRRISGVDIVQGSIEAINYFALFDACDVILAPYDPMHYSTRGSGILSEAIAYGKPIIATAGTAAAKAIERGDCIGRICEFEARALGEAMLNILRDLPDLRAKAQRHADAWLENNSVEAYCDALERLSGRARPPDIPKTKLIQESLEPAFPELVGSAPPVWRDPRHECASNIQWLEPGDARIESAFGRLCFRWPTIRARHLGIVVSSATPSASSHLRLTLNGNPIGRLAINSARERHHLRLGPNIVSAGMPCWLDFERDDDASPILIHEIRAIGGSLLLNL